MTSFDALLRHLRAVLESGTPFRADTEAAAAAERWLRAFQAEGYASLPRTPLEALGRGETALYRLRAACDLLAATLAGERARALALAHTLLELPLTADPFGDDLFALAGAVAEAAGGDPRPFAAQRRRYEARFGGVRAVAGLGNLLSDPRLLAMLEDTRAAPDAPTLTVPLTPPEGGFIPVARDGDEALRLYSVQVRRLLEARTARFAVTRATLVDLSEGSAAPFADLLLDFGGPEIGDTHGDPALLARLNAEPLGLRFVFSGAEEVETFSTADGTLFDTEVSNAEGRLYFKLRLPERWRAAGPLHAFWSRLECCVLFQGD